MEEKCKFDGPAGAPREDYRGDGSLHTRATGGSTGAFFFERECELA